jgi:hypothetical protein
MTTESNIRAALECHWAASDANDFDAEHQIYRQDAVLEYPQSATVPLRTIFACRSRMQLSRQHEPAFI